MFRRKEVLIKVRRRENKNLQPSPNPKILRINTVTWRTKDKEGKDAKIWQQANRAHGNKEYNYRGKCEK